MPHLSETPGGESTGIRVWTLRCLRRLDACAGAFLSALRGRTRRCDSEVDRRTDGLRRLRGPALARRPFLPQLRRRSRRRGRRRYEKAHPPFPACPAGFPRASGRSPERRIGLVPVVEPRPTLNVDNQGCDAGATCRIETCACRHRSPPGDRGRSRTATGRRQRARSASAISPPSSARAVGFIRTETHPRPARCGAGRRREARAGASSSPCGLRPSRRLRSEPDRRRVPRSGRGHLLMQNRRTKSW